MSQEGLHYRKSQLLIQAILIIDIIFCLTLLGLLFLSLGPSNLQVEIYYHNYVENISIVSSIIGFFLAGALLLKMRFLGPSFRVAALCLQICIIAGLLHLICALAMIFYYATSWGMLPIILGYIYREYGYIQLVNAVLFFGLFVYFIRCLRPPSKKGKK